MTCIQVHVRFRRQSLAVWEAKLRLDEKRKPQDGGFSAKIDGKKVDFRVSTMPSYYGEKVVMRVLDAEKGVKPLDQLGLSEINLKMITLDIIRMLDTATLLRSRSGDTLCRIV